MPTEPTPSIAAGQRFAAHRAETPRKSVPDQLAVGVVKIMPLANGFVHVAIGRNRGTRRFNLSRAEAAELARLLVDDYLTFDRPARCRDAS